MVLSAILPFWYFRRRGWLCRPQQKSLDQTPPGLHPDPDDRSSLEPDSDHDRKDWAYEDFVEGASIDLGTKLVTAAEIIEFASEFDPQPMHLDEAAGKASILGGLAASGWHTCAMFMRMLCDAFLLDSTSQGAPGIDQVKWKRPVLAGDTLTGSDHGAGQAPVEVAAAARPGHDAQRTVQPARRKRLRTRKHRACS